MSDTDAITDRLEEFKKSGLIASYELVVLDDSLRVRIATPPEQDAATVKAFVAEAFAGRLSDSQISIEGGEAPAA